MAARDVMTATEVAALFNVKRATVARWAKRGRLRGFTTAGGHWRFYVGDVIDARERNDDALGARR